MSILNTIVEFKKKEIASCKEIISVEDLCKRISYNRNTNSLKEFIANPLKTGIIAEFKRKSPSKGIINDKVDVAEVTRGYSENGASALSVLTDFNFFGGSIDDLQKTRAVNDIPILRKEFIIDEYQVYESKAIGADAILLIAAILKKDEALLLAKLANELGMQVLMELHDEDELDLVNEYIDVVGVNNRNLNTFDVNLEHSAKLAGKIPGNFLKVSESGISSAKDISFLMEYGFQGFLIGENFMKTPDPVKAFIDFTNEINNKK
jgi:indole-3-glycerol phosphate synthase